MRTYNQERPQNPFERGILQVSGNSPHLASLTIGAPGDNAGLPLVINTCPEPVAGQYKAQTDILGTVRRHQSPDLLSELRAKPFDMVIVSRSGSDDPSFIVAEAKVAANSANADVRSYFELSSIVERELSFFLFAGREQTFEDGIESEFSQNFVRIITRYKKIALDSLQKLIESNSINAEVLAEALRWLPRIQDPLTYNQRLSLVTRCLFLPWSRVRDAATLALSSLADQSAVSALKRAIELETVEELRADMEQALTYLESISSATSS